MKFFRKKRELKTGLRGGETKFLRRREMLRFSAQMKNVALGRSGELHPG